MVREYLGVDGKRLVLFTGLVIAVLITVTGIYWSLYGREQWTTKMQQGANLMVAAVPTASQGQTRSGMSMAGQYVCPSHGAVGLPAYDAAGVPHCPICNQAMCFNSASDRTQPNSTVLAAGGG